MNKQRVSSWWRQRGHRLSRRLVVQYFLSLAVYAAGVCVLVLLCWGFFSSFTWQPEDLCYRILCFVRDYLLFFLGLAFMAGWTVITYFFLSKPLRYLEELATASKQLASPSEEPILLSGALSEVQNELNLTREKALRDAAAAREAEQRKNDLVVYLAHDLKTPLTSVIGYLSLLRDEPEISPALRDKYTGVALAKAERLEELINEFFDITRFNLSSLSLAREKVNLTRLLEQTTFEFMPLLAEKELCWDLALESGVMLSGDGDKLARVFDNLLRNAVNYCFAGTKIGVSLKRQEDRAVVQIRNRGKTIAPEKLSRIFEQFFRLDSSRSSATGGAGLGLAIAKEIVELHGGSIRAESAEESICFTVELPA